MTVSSPALYSTFKSAQARTRLSGYPFSTAWRMRVRDPAASLILAPIPQYVHLSVHGILFLQQQPLGIAWRLCVPHSSLNKEPSTIESPLSLSIFLSISASASQSALTDSIPPPVRCPIMCPCNEAQHTPLPFATQRRINATQVSNQGHGLCRQPVHFLLSPRSGKDTITLPPPLRANQALFLTCPFGPDPHAG